MIDFPYEAEVRLLRWAESSNAGRTITLEIPPGNGEGHPFQGFQTGHQHGQRFRMRFTPIDDNEEPARDPGATSDRRRPDEAPMVVIPPPPPASPAGAFSPQKERYASLDDMDRAVADAGRLARDERFQQYTGEKAGLPPGEDLAASFIRAHCGVGSRKGIALSDQAYRAFLELKTEFEIWAGRMAEPRR